MSCMFFSFYHCEGVKRPKQFQTGIAALTSFAMTDNIINRQMVDLNLKTDNYQLKICI